MTDDSALRAGKGSRAIGTPDADPDPAQTLPELVRRCAEDSGDRLALVSGPRRFTYAELAAQVADVAAGLSAAGVRPKDQIGLLAPNIPEWVMAAFGALSCGARVDAFNTWVKAYDLDYLLTSSQVSTLVMVDRVRSTDLVGELLTLIPEMDGAEPGQWRSERFPALRRVVVIGDRVPTGALPWSDIATPGEDALAPTGSASGDDCAFVVYTSGSTKNPKAVPLDHRNLIVNGFYIGERMGLTPDDRVWLASPLFWSYGCANALMATFTHRARLVLQERFEPAATAELMRREEVTAAYLLPAMSEALAATCAEKVRALESLRTGLTIGRPEEVERVALTLGVSGICNIYGATENYGNCCVTDHRMPLGQRLTTQGQPLPGVEIRIVDEATGQPLGPEVPGEAQIRGRLTKGYLGDDEANAKAFTKDGWYRSGDRMVLHANGTITFVDRATDMIKSSGINVSPAEVESFLTTHPEVVEAVVVGAPDPARGEVVVAFVVSTSADLCSDDLIAYCRERVASYKVPRIVTVVEELPRTGTGKIARRMLKDPAAALASQLQDGA